MSKPSLVFCEDVLIDQTTGQWSFLKQIENINLSLLSGQADRKDKLVIRGRFNLVSFWFRQKSQSITIQYQLADSRGDLLMNSPEYRLTFNQKQILFRHRVMLDRLIVRGPGSYSFKVARKTDQGYRTEAEIFFNISIRQNEETGK